MRFRPTSVAILICTSGIGNLTTRLDWQDDGPFPKRNCFRLLLFLKFSLRFALILTEFKQLVGVYYRVKLSYFQNQFNADSDFKHFQIKPFVFVLCVSLTHNTNDTVRRRWRQYHKISQGKWGQHNCQAALSTFLSFYGQAKIDRLCDSQKLYERWKENQGRKNQQHLDFVPYWALCIMKPTNLQPQKYVWVC